MTGRFITLEGSEGVGKSTQTVMLAEWLTEQGKTVRQFREPGGTPGAEAIRALLLDGGAERWDAKAEALLFAAARSDLVAREIRPALICGTWVICDRYLDSSRAYQSGGSGLSDDDIMALHRFGSGGLLPDLTLLLTCPSDLTQTRVQQRDGGEPDRIGGRDATFHSAVLDAFAKYARAEPTRFCSIDASGSLAEVHARVQHVVQPLIG